MGFGESSRELRRNKFAPAAEDGGWSTFFDAEQDEILLHCFYSITTNVNFIPQNRRLPTMSLKKVW